MFTAVLLSLSFLTLIHVGSPYYQKNKELKNVVLWWEELEAAQGTCSLSSLQEALASPHSPQKSLAVTGRGTGCVLSPCVYSEHQAFKACLQSQWQMLGCIFSTKALAQINITNISCPPFCTLQLYLNHLESNELLLAFMRLCMSSSSNIGS